MEFQLTSQEGQFLIQIARKAVEKYLQEGKVICEPNDLPSKFRRKYGIFITLNTMERSTNILRGCIGFPYPTLPLIKAIINSAINSATSDPRFQPLLLKELPKIVFEISILTPPILINVKHASEYPYQIEIGKDGLIVEKGYNKGLLLPQVPIEWNWSNEEFLCQCCMKAGLSPDCWILADTKIYKFSCLIVKELSPKGKIVIEDLRKI